jgi:hypothetical protein
MSLDAAPPTPPDALPAAAQRVQPALDARAMGRCLVELPVWALGGTAHCVFPVAPAELAAASGGREIEID